METFAKVVEIGYRVAIVAVACTALYWYYDGKREGKDLRIVVIEQRGLLDRLRRDFDVFKDTNEKERKGLLDRLANLERRRDIGAQE